MEGGIQSLFIHSFVCTRFKQKTLIVSGKTQDGDRERRKERRNSARERGSMSVQSKTKVRSEWPYVFNPFGPDPVEFALSNLK